MRWVGFLMSSLMIRSRRVLYDVEPGEGEVVVYRSQGELSIGVVVAEMHCTQWIQPLVAHELSDERIDLFEDDETNPVQVQGDCVALIDAEYGQRPIPSLGGGIGYGAPAVDCWTVETKDLPKQLELRVTDQGMAPWTH